MTDHKTRILHAIGAALMGTALYVLVTQTSVWGNIALVFAFVMGAALAATMPADVRDYYRQREYEHAERQFTLQQKRASLFAATGPVPPVGPAYNARQEKWRKWFIARIEDAKRAGGPHYKGGMSAYVSFDIWKNVFHRHLFALRLVGPIINGQRTEWASGITEDAAIAVVRAAHPLPCPDDADPLPETAPGSERENASENARFAL